MNSPEPSQPSSSRELMLHYLSGEIDAADTARLNELLLSAPALRAEFAELLLMDVQLTEIGREVRSSATIIPFSQPSKTAGWRRPWFPVALAASLVFLLGLGLWYFGSAMGEPVLADVKGADISVKRGTEHLTAAATMPLLPGDIVRLGNGASAALTFGTERTRIDLESGTELKLGSLTSGKRLELRTGKFAASVARQRPFQPMIITTPNAEARVLGTEFTLTVRTNHTKLDVTEGKVLLADMANPTNQPVKVSAGHSAVVAPSTRLAALPQTGLITREWWNGVSWIAPSDSLDDPRFPGRPDGKDTFNRFEFEPVATNRFGLRLRGYVHPPVTGDYEFWLAGCTEAQLFLSPSERAKEKVLIGTVFSNVGPRDWDAPRSPGDGSNRRSGTFHLEAGKRYFIEALLTVPKGEGHLSVAWKRPGAPRELLGGQFLSPAETSK